MGLDVVGSLMRTGEEHDGDGGESLGLGGTPFFGFAKNAVRLSKGGGQRKSVNQQPRTASPPMTASLKALSGLGTITRGCRCRRLGPNRDRG